MADTCSRGKILYFAHCNNYHTVKWVRHFVSAGYSVHVASLEKCSNSEITSIPGVKIHWLRNSGARTGGSMQKIRYLAAVRAAKNLINRIDPDVIHAHYASSYGLLCALSCRRPYYLSVWGNDVYDFPKKSFFHRIALKYSLNKCSWLLSTSEAMAEETGKYTDKSIAITPFGVDRELFNPRHRDRASDGVLTIGTVKALERKYGIDVLLKAVAEVAERRPDLRMRLRIAGEGTLKAELKDLATRLGIADMTVWLGFISQEEAAREWANFDIGVVASTSESESFGVSALECQASGTPLVISDIPGLMEACDGGRTALVVRRNDVSALASSLEFLAAAPTERAKMGVSGRQYVSETYEIHDCFQRVGEMYQKNMRHERGGRIVLSTKPSMGDERGLG